MRSLSAILAGALIIVACSEAEDAPSGLNSDIGESPNAGEPMLNAGNLSEDQQEAGSTAPLSRTPQTQRRAVRIGLDGLDMDACGGIGRVTGLNASGDNFLSVRERPDVNAPELDRLDPEALVWMCEVADGNGWHGVVYDSGAGPDSAGDCGLGTPIEGEQDYGGICRSGWVSPRYIELIAG